MKRRAFRPGVRRPLEPAPAALEVVTVPPAGELAPELQQLRESAAGYARESISVRTRETYAGEWKRWEAWCKLQKFTPLPARPEVIALYLAELADRGRRPNGIEVVLVAINQAHLRAGLSGPRAHRAIQQVRKGIRRKLGTAPRPKDALAMGDLQKVCRKLPEDPIGERDRALLLLCFAGAFRRSELVGLDVDSVEFVDEGLQVHIGRSKTDQEGIGRLVGIVPGDRPHTCPVRAVRVWLERRGAEPGPLFVSMKTAWRGPGRGEPVAGGRLQGREVARILKRRAAEVGLDVEGLAGHSLRAGFVTSAAKAGKPLWRIRGQTGHKSLDMLGRYIRGLEVWDDNPSAGIGL